MNKTTSIFVSGFLVGVLVATVGFSILRRYQASTGDAGNNAQIVLKLGHSLDVAHPAHKAIENMRERLESLSGGEMTIDIYPSSVLGSETQCIEQLQNGSLSLTRTSAAVIENFVPEMAVFGLPYVFRDQQHFRTVLDGEIGKRLLLEGESRFVRGLCYHDSGSRNFYGKFPVMAPKDLSGRKIRVMNSATAIAMVEAMGAAPTPIAPGELYSALSQGIVDGAENNLPTFAHSRHYEVCKHFSLDGHTRIPALVLVGTKAWNQLTPQQQQWLQTAAIESATVQRELWATATDEARQIVEAAGVTIHEVNVQNFAKQVKPMLDLVSDAKVKATLAAIQKVESDE
ncbi:TRAP transporter substrate-binding protein [Mariniblastus sp.]|nr:TRAP transporter substrate-binding protein [Mariniblastus sp.]